MKPTQYILRSLPFCLILLAGIAGFFALMSMRSSPETVSRADVAPLVETIPIRKADSALRLEADGEVVPFKQVSLSAEVSGRIQKKSEACRAGQFVEAGQLLLQIDPRDYQLAIRRTQESLRQTEISIEELDVEVSNTEQLVELAKQDFGLQQREVKRYEDLMSQRAASQAELDAAQRRLIQASNTLQTQRNQLRLLTTRRGRLLSEKERLAVQLEQAMLNRERCEITAPISGVIVSDPVEQDDFVQPGTQLVQLEDTERLEVRFDLKLDQLRWIWSSSGRQGNPLLAAQDSFKLPKLPVSIFIETDGGQYHWQGHLSRYDDAGLDPATRTVPCIATVDDPRAATWRPSDGSTDLSASDPTTAPPSLLRGMFVQLRFDVPLNRSLLEIPTTALRPGNQIWIEEAGKLAVRDIKIAQTYDDHVAFFPNSQVQPGDSSIVTPLSLGIDGMRIRPQSRTMKVADRSEAHPSINGHAKPSSAEMSDQSDSRTQSTGQATDRQERSP